MLCLMNKSLKKCQIQVPNEPNLLPQIKTLIASRVVLHANISDSIIRKIIDVDQEKSLSKNGALRIDGSLL